MPFKSEKQRRYLHIHEPELARRWEREYGSKPSGPKESLVAKMIREKARGSSK